MINDKINELQDQERVVRQAAKQIRRQRSGLWDDQKKIRSYNLMQRTPASGVILFYLMK